MINVLLPDTPNIGYIALKERHSVRKWPGLNNTLPWRTITWKSSVAIVVVQMSFTLGEVENKAATVLSPLVSSAV